MEMPVKLSDLLSKRGLTSWSETVSEATALFFGLLSFWAVDGIAAFLGHLTRLSVTLQGFVNWYVVQPLLALTLFLGLTGALYLLSKSLGGMAGFKQFLKSIVWAYLPYLLAGVLWVSLWGIIPEGASKQSIESVEKNLPIISILLLVLATWVTVRVTQGIAYTQKITMFKAGALATVLAFPVTLGIAIFGVNFLFRFFK